MIKKTSIDLSVHQLVDFLLGKGDIDNRVFNRSSMNEGTLLHALYQSKQGDNYLSEVQLNTSITIDEITVNVQGRSDGIIVNGNEYTVDEIKTTVIDLKEFRNENLEWHLGQAKVYAYIFAKDHNLKHIGVRLTYIRQGKTSEKLFDNYLFAYEELEKFFHDLVEEYLAFYNIVLRKIEARDESIKHLEFPFSSYRSGQRELAKYCYSIAKNGGNLFVEAPTGIGKTMSTLFPFIKTLGDDEKSKIFYLTAKNSGKMNAANALNILRNSGLKISDVSITAKEKICFCKDKACNPEECPFTKGYYNKIKDVIKQSLVEFDEFDYETIVAIAKTFEVCPFELELDLSLFVDVIICDYNYMFHPISYMKRYFDDDATHFLALIDEAHNLVDRSRDMYSASLSLSNLLEAKKSLKHVPSKKLKMHLNKINKIFDIFVELPLGNTEFIDINYDSIKPVDKFITAYQEESKDHYEYISKELTKFYIECNKFKKISEVFSDNFIFYADKKENDISLNIACLDASSFLKEALSKIKGSILFSATLSPISYYKTLLGGKENDPSLILSSPFPEENIKILVAPKVSTKYKNRDSSYEEVAEYIENFVTQKVGNYFVYLPSYEYLNRLLEVISLPDDIDVHIQNRDMTDIDKEAFLNAFKPNPKKTHLGFVIIGGAFGEGIDLVSDRLIGLVIVGIGLSRINFVDDKIRDYYKTLDMNGYHYAYLYPGMNKVMQAVGRLIRSEKDRGIALLIDERYLTREYRSLFRKEWEDYEVVTSPEDISFSIQRFFKK